MKARIKWVQDRTFRGESGSEHSIVMDGAPDEGVRDFGIRPMKTLLMGCDGYTAYDVVDILEREREAVEDCVLEIDTARADDIPKVFTKIALKYLVTGKKPKPQKRRTAKDIRKIS